MKKMPIYFFTSTELSDTYDLFKIILFYIAACLLSNMPSVVKKNSHHSYHCNALGTAACKMLQNLPILGTLESLGQTYVTNERLQAHPQQVGRVEEQSSTAVGLSTNGGNHHHKASRMYAILKMLTTVEERVFYYEKSKACNIKLETVKILWKTYARIIYYYFLPKQQEANSRV